MKICNLILTYDDPLYNKFDSYKRSYLNKFNPNFLFVYNSNNPTNYDPQNKIYNYNSKHPYNASGIPSMFEKFIDVIKSGLLDDFDFVIRENSSTFVNMNLVTQHLCEKQNNLYMGFFEPNWQFVSGACIILSKDVIVKIAQHYSKVSSFQEDDVAIGKIMNLLNISKTHLERASYDNRVSIPTTNEIKHALTKPQIRIRNDFNREIIDVGIWEQIHQLTT